MDNLPPWPPDRRDRVIHQCDVVIPYTNIGLHWLVQSIESILNQTNVECFIHLIRDCPPIAHDPIEHFASFPCVQWYYNLESVGPYVSMHRVWKYMKSDFVAVQDSDDIALPSRIWYSIETLEKTGGDIFGAAMERFVSYDDIDKDRYARIVRINPILNSSMNVECEAGYNFIRNPTLVCRREAFERVNGFLPFKCGADLEFTRRAERFGLKIVIAPYVLELYRMHSLSLSNSPAYMEGLQEKVRAQLTQIFEQHKQPDVDLTRFGTLDGDKENSDTIVLTTFERAPPRRPIAPKPIAEPIIALFPWPPVAPKNVTYQCDVVIPYTAANIRWLSQSIESILNQNNTDCLIHLIQDGPLTCDNYLHDKIRLLCDSSCVQWYYNLESVGPYVSMHRVWRHMKSDFVAVQDSDDIALPSRIWYSIDVLEKTGGDIFGAAMEQFISHENSTKKRAIYSLDMHLKERVRSDYPRVINGTMVCRRATFERMNGFIPLRCGADSEFPIRLHYSGFKVITVPHIVALRRLHGDSLYFGSDHGLGSTNREAAWKLVKQAYGQYGQPGVDYAKFGGLDIDRESPDTIMSDYRSQDD